MREPKRVAVLALLLLLPLTFAAAEDNESDCGICHDVVTAEFAMTPHGMAGKQATSCESCHGDGTAHMDEGGDPSLIMTPTGNEAREVCLQCHQDAMVRVLPSSAAHPAAAVYCDDCHSIHPDEGELARANLLHGEANALCISCHARTERAFERPFGHDLNRGGIQCVSCHDPHGGAGERSLRLDSSGQGPCVSCHAEKRGPFVFPHVSGVTGDCSSCHEPHGSSNPSALTRATVAQLCLECHSSFSEGTLGSQPPSFHNLRDPRYRECTTCHVAVHGSNTSPTLVR